MVTDMCMLTYCPAGAVVSAERLRNGSVVNNDGHGWAVVDSSRLVIHTGHSMDFEEALASFLVARALHPHTDAMFHSRFTTHGVSNVDNCHPFRVPGWRDTVVGHNGVLPCTPDERWDPRSDTRLFVEDILTRRFPVLDSQKTQRRLMQWMGWSKILVLTIDPRHSRTAYLFGESQGEWVDGVWYSNSGYAPRKAYSYKPSAYDWVPRYAQNKETGEWEKIHDDEFDSTQVADEEYESFDDYILRLRRQREAIVDDYVGTSTYTVDTHDDGTVERFYGAGREGAVLGPRKAADRAMSGYFPERFQCPQEACQSFNVDVALNLCLSCEGCMACMEHVTGCGCWDEPEPEPESATGAAFVTVDEAVAALEAAGFVPTGDAVDAAVAMSSDRLETALALAGTAVGWPRAIEAAPGIITSLGSDSTDGGTV